LSPTPLREPGADAHHARRDVPLLQPNRAGHEKYGYDFDPPYDYFRMWHSQGGSLIFADGHAKFVASSKEFDETLVSPEGLPSGGGSYPNEYYWMCD
jgi:hypothetical protein